LTVRGEQVDLHALRHSCASWLAEGGTHPKVAQELMRHTDPRLTLRAYTHATREQQLKALECLPKLENVRPTSTTDVTTNVTTAAAGVDEGGAIVSEDGKAVNRQNDGECGSGDQKKQGLTPEVNPCLMVETRGFEPPTSRVRF